MSSLNPLNHAPVDPQRVRVVAGSHIPPLCVAGPYPGEFKFGRNLDDLPIDVMIKVCIYQYSPLNLVINFMIFVFYLFLFTLNSQVNCGHFKRIVLSM
jgi:hypothetical protein